jgi:hypothetical protein
MTVKHAKPLTPLPQHKYVAWQERKLLDIQWLIQVFQSDKLSSWYDPARRTELLSIQPYFLTSKLASLNEKA